ncbi:FHA domain-containing protein [Streptomyces sp. NPDC002574]|uniref:FHA domain-containing protein n=1 Tax=Streptomyces sp. NPDC002574 TaxID=3364652 RepID=UPI0036B34FCD
MSHEFPTSSAPPSAPAPRPTEAEREHAIEVLRGGAVDGRLSHDTFLQRVELALTAGRSDELDALIADLPAAEGRMARLGRWLERGVARISALQVRFRDAWQAEKLPPLLFPAPGPVPLRIGRDLSCGFRLSHASASRIHAELRHEHGVWVLRDLGSMNGTWVNGRRVMGAAVVRPGDRVTFGAMHFRLAAV